MCAHGCNVNARTVRGETALILAISSRKNVPDLVNLLLEAGCDPNIQENILGQTALHVLVRYLVTIDDFSEQSLCMLDNLIQQCDPNITDHIGRTALHRDVASNAPIECVKVTFFRNIFLLDLK